MKREQIALPVVSRETAERLAVFEAEISRWAGTINLVGRNDLTQLPSRHTADSLQLLPLIPRCDDGVFVDLGSGGGFPGLVLAIATGHMFHLVEVDRRKAAFLRHAARICDAPVQVHAERIETASLPPTRLATARAVAPLTHLVRWVQPKLCADGICLFMKGRTAAEELALARAEWDMQIRCWASSTDAEATILQISQISPRGR